MAVAQFIRPPLPLSMLALASRNHVMFRSVSYRNTASLLDALTASPASVRPSNVVCHVPCAQEGAGRSQVVIAMATPIRVLVKVGSLVMAVFEEFEKNLVRLVNRLPTRTPPHNRPKVRLA